MTSKHPSLSTDLSVELVRVTEAAAMAAADHVGRGAKNIADGAAVEAMRETLSGTHITGTVVIGEGEKDDAPMLYVGEAVGVGSGPEVDIAVDPIDGTTLTANGMNNALAVLSMAPRGTMADLSAAYYVKKLVVGPEAAGKVNLNDPVEKTLRIVAESLGRPVSDLTVCVLQRPRHDELIADIRAAGARVKLITDGDVAGGIAAASDGTFVDVLMGIGGAPEAVITACAIICLGGEIQVQPAPQSDDERTRIIAAGIEPDRVLGTTDLVTATEGVYFVATGITDGELLDGVRMVGECTSTTSLALSQTQSRTIITRHRSEG